MPDPHVPNSLQRAATIALVQHELRILWQNRMACVVLAMTLLTAIFLRIDRNRTPPAARDVCYILYWNDDDFVEELRKQVVDPEQTGGLKFEVLPAAALTGADGIIRYPPGSHSIQLRSPERVVWYWHSGSDPAAMWPHIEWFQQAAMRHFGRHAGWRVQTSPMKPELLVVGKQTRVTLESIREPEVMDAALVWLVIFFAACHLPKLSLAESIANRTLVSIVVTPAGWAGQARAIQFFYGLLALLSAIVIAAILRPSALASGTFWSATLFAIILYLGVAFTIGTWCRSVASASIGTMVYLTASGIVYALVIGAARIFDGTPATTLVPEAGLLESLQQSWGEGGAIRPFTLAGLMCWAVIWSALGEISYRRIQDQ